MRKHGHASGLMSEGDTIGGGELSTLDVCETALADISIERFVYGGSIARFDDCLSHVWAAHGRPGGYLLHPLPAYRHTQSIQLLHHLPPTEQAAFLQLAQLLYQGRIPRVYE